MEKKKTKVLSTVLFVAGFLLIFISAYPILEYEIVSRRRYPKVVSPISDALRFQILSNRERKTENFASEYMLSNTNSDVENYTLSIPKLKISDAFVNFGGEDLTTSLIQFPGTAKPGQRGNAVVFGHSVLPIFFNPKNYLTIFSTIPRLEVEDEIFVKIENVMYKYVVIEMYEVAPDNFDILDQRADDSYISLVTCVPPGHPLKPRRLVVKAILTKI